LPISDDRIDLLPDRIRRNGARCCNRRGYLTWRQASLMSTPNPSRAPVIYQNTVTNFVDDD
jgi:hypothetical protein